MNNHLITILGTTAIGKTNLSIALAKHFNTEIISCDSRQFYKEMTIGTAVPTKQELKTVKHHFIQNKSIFDTYNVGQYEKEALKKLQSIYKNKNIAVMVGGSGLYANAVLNGLDYFPDVSPTIRENLNNTLKTKGIKFLQNKLKELDLISYQKISIDNPHRIIRALEICIGTNTPYSTFKNKPKEKRNFIPIKIGLTANRETIYQRINQRVDIMIKEGLIEEAKKLHLYKELNALQTVGYKELFLFFEHKLSLKEAIEEIKKNTRRFAKRQITWNKKDTDIIWFNYQTKPNDIIKEIEKIRNEKSRT